MEGTVAAPRRYGMLDSLRGAMLMSMIAYHATWDLVNLFGVRWTWFDSLGGFIWQQSICWAFILLSGFCAPLGRRPLRRGLLVLGAGALVSAATLLGPAASRIHFGVLTFLGICMLLYVPLRRLLCRVPPAAGLAGSAVLFALTRNVNAGFLGFGEWNLAALPAGLYRGRMSAFFGFPPSDFYSADYFSLFPWVFLFFSGYFLYRLCERYDGLRLFSTGKWGALGTLGRHSLLIYLAHQPALYLCLSAVF